MKILLIEDSDRIRSALRKAFIQEGMVVDSTSDGEEGLWYGAHHEYDVIILDIMLPSMEGWMVLQKWRERKVETPVLLLTAKSEVPDRVRGFRLGADDYLTKPFAVEELLERVRALARRRAHQRQDSLSVGDLVLDMRKREARRDGQNIALTPKEFRVLECLLKNKGIVLSRAQIESHIFDSMADPASNVVDVAVASIRKKLRETGGAEMLQTRRGHGYCIREHP